MSSRARWESLKQDATLHSDTKVSHNVPAAGHVVFHFRAVSLLPVLEIFLLSRRMLLSSPLRPAPTQLTYGWMPSSLYPFCGLLWGIMGKQV